MRKYALRFAKEKYFNGHSDARSVQEYRKEDNDQESIQLPNTFRPRHQRERRTPLKHGTTIKTLQAERQKDSFFPKIWPSGYPK